MVRLIASCDLRLHFRPSLRYVGLSTYIIFKFPSVHAKMLIGLQPNWCLGALAWINLSCGAGSLHMGVDGRIAVWIWNLADTSLSPHFISTNQVILFFTLQGHNIYNLRLPMKSTARPPLTRAQPAQGSPWSWILDKRNAHSIIRFSNKIQGFETDSAAA